MKQIDYTEPWTGSVIIAIVLAIIYMIFPEYHYINLYIPVYLILIVSIALFAIPILYIKYYYMPLNKYVPELMLFINARKHHFPVLQIWNENGYFYFEKTDTHPNDSNAPRCFTVRGLDIYQELRTETNEKLSVYKEAYQNITSAYAVPDMQSFRQVIEILKKHQTDTLLKYIIMGAIAIFVILVGVGMFLKLKGA